MAYVRSTICWTQRHDSHTGQQRGALGLNNHGCPSMILDPYANVMGNDTAILILRSYGSLALQEATSTLQCPWVLSLQGESLS